MAFEHTCFVIIMVVLLLSKVSSVISELRTCPIGRSAIISDQSQLDLFMKNISLYEDNPNATRCIHLSLVGNSFKLDLLQLMRINLGTQNGSLIITGNSVIINCTANVTDLEELRDMLQPISRALLVLFDGLVFTRCPVPIVIEEVSTVMIQNCVFL